MLTKLYKRLQKKFSSKYSAQNYEIKYWQKAGIKKGHDFYREYLEKFSIKSDFFKDKIVGEFGCGPFGGVLSVIKDYKQAYPIDILANAYNNWGLSKFKINKFNGKRTSLPGHIIDIMFCCNVIDHTKHPNLIVKEICRLLNGGGVLFLHVHLRNFEELNEAHPISWNKDFFGDLFNKDFRIDWHRMEDLDEINNNTYRTLYARLTRV